MRSQTERQRVDSLPGRWQRFWFAPIPPHSYALLRILLGLLGCLKLIGLRDIATFWALDGLVPTGDNGLGLKAFLLGRGLEDIGAHALFWATVAVFVAMTIGFRTGLTVPLALWSSLIELFWNNFPLSGEHLLTQSILFCLIWVDCGLVWSVDAWLRERRGETTDQALQPIAPLRLIRFQVALIYLSSGLWKLYSPLWRDGSALHYILNNNVVHRFPSLVTPNVEWLLTTATYLTLVWEIAFAFALLYTPTRRLVLVLGVFIHLGMIAFIEVGLFIWVVLASYSAFLDPWLIASLPRRVLSRLRLENRRNPDGCP